MNGEVMLKKSSSWTHRRFVGSFEKALRSPQMEDESSMTVAPVNSAQGSRSVKATPDFAQGRVGETKKSPGKMTWLSLMGVAENEAWLNLNLEQFFRIFEIFCLAG